MNYRQKCPTMCVGFLFRLTWVQRERQRDKRRASDDEWPRAALGASVGCVMAHAQLLAAAQAIVIAVCSLPAELPPGCRFLPISLGYTECIRGRSVIEFHTCLRQLSCVFRKVHVQRGGCVGGWEERKMILICSGAADMRADILQLPCTVELLMLK